MINTDYYQNEEQIVRFSKGSSSQNLEVITAGITTYVSL